MSNFDLLIAGLKRALTDGLNLENIGYDMMDLDRMNPKWTLELLHDLYVYACGLDINNLEFILLKYHTREIYLAALGSEQNIMSRFNNGFCNNDLLHVGDYKKMVENGMLRALVELNPHDCIDIVALFENIFDKSVEDWMSDRVIQLGFAHDDVEIPSEWKTQSVYNAIYENRKICDTTAIYLLRQFSIFVQYTGTKPQNKWRNTLLLLNRGGLIPIDLFCYEVDDIMRPNSGRVCNWANMFWLLKEVYDFYDRPSAPNAEIAEHISYIGEKYPQLFMYIECKQILNRDYKYYMALECKPTLNRDYKRYVELCPEFISIMTTREYENNGVPPDSRKKYVLDSINNKENARISFSTLMRLYDSPDQDDYIVTYIVDDVFGESSLYCDLTLIQNWPWLISRSNPKYITNEYIHAIYKIAPHVLHNLSDRQRNKFLIYLGGISA
jgi:hypothetical protein